MTVRLVPAVLAALASGCEGAGGGDAPAPLARQVVSGRDLANPFFWNASTLAFTRPTELPGASGEDLWVTAVASAAAPDLAASGLSWQTDPHTLAGDVLVTGGRGERVFELGTRAALNLDGIDYSAVRSDGALAVAYRSTGRPALLVGRPPTVAEIGDLVVRGVDFLGQDLAVLGHRGVDPSPDALYRLDPASGVLAPLPVAAFDDDAGAAAPLRCGSFHNAPCALFRVVGCGAATEPCGGGGPPPCVILYQRAVSDGGGPPRQQPFAYEVATGQETALPGADPSGFWISPDQHRVAWMHADWDGAGAASNGAGAETNVVFRDFCSGETGQCPMRRPLDLQWRSDSRALVASLAEGGIATLTFPAGSCSVPPQATGVVDRRFAPDNQHLAWRSLPPGQTTASLWLSDGDGSGARMVAAGGVIAFHFSADGQRLFVARSAVSTTVMSWLDLREEPPVERVLVGDYGGAGAFGSRRVLLLDRWNSQDGSGTLELIDLQDGARQVLARAVTAFTLAGSADDAGPVAYVVHGRFASDEDGLWQADLPAAAPSP